MDTLVTFWVTNTLIELHSRDKIKYVPCPKERLVRTRLFALTLMISE